MIQTIKDWWNGMGRFKEQEIERLEAGEPEPEMDEGITVAEPKKYPESDFNNMQAKLFIKTVNDFQGYINLEWLAMFNREVVEYAINVANKAARDNAPESQWNRIYNAKRYWAIVNYLEETR